MAWGIAAAACYLGDEEEGAGRAVDEEGHAAALLVAVARRKLDVRGQLELRHGRLAELRHERKG